MTRFSRFLTMSITAAASVVIAASPVLAAESTYDLNFSFTGFNGVNPVTATIPFSTVTGEVQITFDPSLAYSNEQTGILLDSLNLPFDRPLAFTYAPAQGAFLAQLFVGGLSATSNSLGLNPSANNFYLQINDFGGANVAFLSYVNSSSVSTFNNASAPQLSVTVVPEPEEGAMLAASLWFIGWKAWRRRKAQ